MGTSVNNNSPETPKPIAVKYKHRDIKVYSSDEWMAATTNTIFLLILNSLDKKGE
ncbi:MAG: hypothetical protein ACKO96_12270 [Flammeovirgaceae bacterium]